MKQLANSECLVAKAFSLSDHISFSNTTNIMRAMTKFEYSEESYDINGTVVPQTAVAGNTYTEKSKFEMVRNITASYFTDVAYYLKSYKNKTLPERQDFIIDMNITCSISGNSKIDNKFIEIYEENPLPSWVKIGENETSIEMRTPNVASIKNFTFGLESTVDGMKHIKNFYLFVIPEDPPTKSIVILIFTTLALNLVYMIITCIFVKRRISSPNAIFTL